MCKIIKHEKTIGDERDMFMLNEVDDVSGKEMGMSR